MASALKLSALGRAAPPPGSRPLLRSPRPRRRCPVAGWSSALLTLVYTGTTPALAPRRRGLSCCGRMHAALLAREGVA
jgi:hypothetical protein